MSLTQAIQIIITASIPWALALMLFSYAQTLPRLWFVIIHYIADIVLFGAAFFIYFKYLAGGEPFLVMALAMATIFIIEFIFWKFIYNGELWFLTFVDWIVPAFIVAATIYLVGVYLANSAI